jgi:hypothetical protein
MHRIRLLLVISTLGVLIGGCGLFTLVLLGGQAGSITLALSGRDEQALDPFLGGWMNLEDTTERLYIKKQDGSYLVRRGDKTYVAREERPDYLRADDGYGEGPVGFTYERKYGFLSAGYGERGVLYVRDSGL